jgi:HNH endonuclease
MPKKDFRNGLDWDVFVRDRYTCRYCGLAITAFDNRWDLFVADHLKPRNAKNNAGGPDTIMNLVTACVGCNALKSNFDPTNGGPAPETKQEQERLVEIAKGHIKTRREKFVPDAIEMQREAGCCKAIAASNSN